MPTTDDDELLEAIVKHGERRHVLWELAADGRDFCGIEYTINEAGLEDAPVEEQVETFMTGVDEAVPDPNHWESDGYEDLPRLAKLEESYGNKADELIARFSDED